MRLAGCASETSDSVRLRGFGYAFALGSPNCCELALAGVCQLHPGGTLLLLLQPLDVLGQAALQLERSGEAKYRPSIVTVRSKP